MYQTKIRGAPLATTKNNVEFCRSSFDEEFGGELAYSVVDDILSTSVIIYVDGDAAQGGYFRGELLQTSVVLALALVGLGHGGGGLG